MTLEKVYDELISMIEDLRSGQRLADSAIADLQKETQGAQRSTGNPIEINAAPVNAEALTVTLMPYQTGSGDPSPTNIRPITGYTECEVDDVGVNQWDEEWDVGMLVDGGAVQPSQSNRRTTSYIPVYDYKTYFSSSAWVLGGRVAYYDVNKTCIYYSGIGLQSRYITPPTGARYMRITLNSEYGTTYNRDISINYPSTITTYQPYHSSNATIQFGQTVYGGSVNFNTGLVTITDANIAFYDGESLSGAWISDRDVYVPNTTPTTGAQVVYELAEPTTLQLTPAELKLLKSINHISTNGTTIQLTYQPDNVLGQILAESEAYADSVVTITPALESGTKLADYTISGTAGIIYGPGETQATRKTTTKKSTKEE